MTYPLTHIDPSAKIGQNVTIDPFTMIHGDVEIGDGTWIGSNVTIFPGARIGKNVRIFPGAVISAIPQDLKFGGEKTTAEIGDNTTIRECVTINRGTVDKDRTVVGKNCLIMAYVHIAHDCQIADNCILANSVQMAGHVTVGEYAIIGGSTAIHQFASIGKHVMISGGSLVRKDVPPYTKSGREPLTYAGINSVGLRRRNFTDEQIADIQEIYRYVYQKGLNIQTALSEIEEQISPSSERDEILSFIRSSERGIMKG
ncbi:acyl-ACP--UDP-N-acetylglucosamine O-acyltransferase [Aquirufa aurantiipilula]|uniref:Acyl-ACP--UDP-N-acetylglucosamine O-acyltransferase n=1 Tax=Aquirufa aurantiipilula TaxID=2696561 RepID=A0ABT6BHD1_9BACT|nr:acyl-ACP--UDP-N-acetylglucosamine O-acyltransferase [Aquirufa aurantiipilula]MDF5689867.1 acyl-ACP--UDP-N-acetylglucosamine O-acyltransferase [Aquirufa aurantiipilula]